MKVIHQRKKCIGCGSCVAICPQVFEMSHDNKASIKVKAMIFNPEKEEETLEIEDLGCVKGAADVCPVQCIIIKNNKGV